MRRTKISADAAEFSPEPHARFEVKPKSFGSTGVAAGGAS
jgi:hypothetical protein